MRCDGCFFFTIVNIEGTDDGMAGDGAGVWGWWLGSEVWMGALDIHRRGLIDQMFQCCTSCLVRAASVETPKYLHLVSPLPALVSRILLTRRRNLVSKSALVAEWPKVI